MLKWLGSVDMQRTAVEIKQVKVGFKMKFRTGCRFINLVASVNHSVLQSMDGMEFSIFEPVSL